MAFVEDLYVQQLVEMYRAGFQQIVGTLLDKDARGLSTRYQKDILLDIRRILLEMDDNADLWIEQVVGRVYSSALTDTISFIRRLGVSTATDTTFSKVHQRSIDVVAQNMSNSLRDATQFVGRRVDDVFRKVALEQTGTKIVTGASWQEMKANLMQELLNKGQTAFVDKLGREWRLDTYAEMVARTTTREAASVATINQCQESGIDLVQISTHLPTCHLCAPLQGKVFSLSGDDKRYPELTDDVRPPIHPNCRHVLTPYVRELDPNADETERHSTTSRAKDPRTESEKKAYKDIRDAVTIKTNRRRAREVLYTPSLPQEDKVKAAKRLENTYKKTGKRPTGRDASLINKYRD